MYSLVSVTPDPLVGEISSAQRDAIKAVLATGGAIVDIEADIVPAQYTYEFSLTV